LKRWSVLSSRLVLHRPPWLKVTEQRCLLPNGHVIEDYILAEGRDVVMVFPYTPDGQVVLVEQYKHGCERILWDLPAGYMDADDATPLSAAQREPSEETGCTADDWTHLASLHPDPTRSGNVVHFYLATGARRTCGQRLDDTEDINIHEAPLSALPRMVSEGKIAGMSSVAGIGLGVAALVQRRLVVADFFPTGEVS
jgi:8-oxo-dGTP pyrophosphatase MutT (NUDIX family)